MPNDFTNLSGAKIDTEKTAPRNTDEKARYGKGRKFGSQRVNTDDFSGNIHIANSRPFAPERAAGHVSRKMPETVKKTRQIRYLAQASVFGPVTKYPKTVRSGALI